MADGTVEAFFVEMGIKPESVQQMLDTIQALRARIGAEPLKLLVEADAKEAQKIVEDLAKQPPSIDMDFTAHGIDEAIADMVSMREQVDQVKQQFEEAGARGTKALDDIRNAAEQLRGGILALGGFGAGIAAIFTKASQEASQDEIAVKRLELAFGATAEAAKQYAAQVAKSTGIQEGAFQAQLAELRNMASGFGLTGAAADDFAKKIAGISLDTARAQGRDFEEVVNALSTAMMRSGIEARKLGVDLSDAALEKAASNFGKTAKELTDTEKAAAKLAIITDSLKGNLGAASASGQTFAVDMRNLRDAVSEAASALGKQVNDLLRPYIAAMTQVVRAIKEWVEANPTLTSALVASAGFVGALAIAVAAAGGAIVAMNFAANQWAAASKLVNALTVAWEAATVRSTLATQLNTEAVVVNNAAQKGSFLQSLIELGVRFWQALNTQTGVIWENTAAWIANAQAQAGLTSLGLLDWLARGIGAIGGFTLGVVQLTRLLVTGQISLTGFVNGVTGGLVPALTTSVSKLSNLTVGVSAAAAAFAGWQLGKAIDDLLGFSKAAENAVAGVESFADKAKNAFLGVISGGLLPLYELWLKFQVAQADSAADEAAQRLVDTFKEGSAELENYNRLLKKGVEWRKAARMAYNPKVELQDLQAKAEQTKLTAEEEKRLNELERQFPNLAANSASAMKEAMTTAEQRTKVMEDLKKAEEKYLEIAQKTSIDLIKLKKGETEAAIAEARAQTIGKLQELQKAADAEKAQIASLEGQKLVSSKTLSDAAKAENAKIEADIQEHATTLAGIRQTMIRVEETDTLTLIALAEKRTDELRKQGEQQIADAKKQADEIVAAYDKAISDIDQQLNALKSNREKGNEAALTYAKGLERDDLRRHDRAQAAIADELERAEAVVKGAEDEQLRQRIISGTLSKLEELAQTTQAEKKAVEEASKARQAADAARASRAANAAQLAAEATTKEQAAAEIVGLQAERQDALKLAKESLFAADKEAGAWAEANAGKIKELEDEKLKIQQWIREEREKELAACKGIEDSTARQIELLKLYKEALLAGAEAAKAAQRTQGATAGTSVGNTATGTATAGAQQQMEHATEQQTRLSQATQDFTKTMQEWGKQITAQLSNMMPEFAVVSQQLADIQALFPDVIKGMDALLDAETSMGDAITNLSNTLVDKLGGVTTEVKRHAGQIQTLQQKINSMNMSGEAVNPATGL